MNSEQTNKEINDIKRNMDTEISYQRPKFRLLKKLINPATLFTSSSKNPFINDGYALLDEANFEQAIRAFQAAIKEDIHCIEAYIGLAKTMSTQGGIDKAKSAIKYLQQALDIDYTKIEIYREVIDLFERLGDKKNATIERKKQSIARTLKSSPNDSKANNNMGVLQLKQRNFDSAIQFFKKSIKADRKFLNAKLNLANTFLQKALILEKKSEKISLLKTSNALMEDVLAVDKTAQTYLLKAKILLHMENVKQAAEICEKAYQLDPGMKEIINTKRAIEEKLGKISDASASYEQYKSMNTQESKMKKDKLISPFDD